MNQYKPASRTVQVSVGQSLTANFKVTPDVLYTEQVQVVGDSRLIETRTSEVSTTVTTEQVRFLPQNQRNFLNFAALAPGARVSDNDTRKQVTGGGLDATQINVFIDGVSYKNDVLDGGVVGQDSSRGSPFPQTAVQEFQVLTQNYKAEHEKASSLVISAVTKSGTNRWSGEGFVFYQDRGLVANEHFAEQRGDPKPPYERFQPGLAIGGPIVKDRVQVFGSYEENRQDRASRVFVGTTPFPPSLDFLRDHRGHVRQPVQREAVLRQDVGATEIRAFSRAQLRPAQRNRHPQLRPADQLRVGGERPQPGRLGAREMARTWRTLDERSHHHLSAIQLEPRAGEHRRHRAELHRRDEDRRARHDAGLHPDARVAARRLHALRAVEGSAHAQGGRRGQLPSIRSGEVLQRQSGVRIPPGRGVYLPVPGAIRRRQSGSQHGQPPGRVLHPGRLERGLEAHVQPGPALGLRVRHAEQRLRDAGVRARPRPRRSWTAPAISPTATTVRRSTPPGSRGSASPTT